MIKNALEIITGSSILKQDDFKALAEINDELQDTWEKVQIFRTRTEMQVSVLTNAKHPTADSKYWQAVREQNVMFQELVMLSYEHRKNAVEIKKLDRDLMQETDEFEKELLEIEIDKKTFVGCNMERTAHDRIREILEWSDCKKELKPLLKYGDQDVNAHQLETMKKRFAYEASLVNQNTAIADKINILGKADAVKG